ncbi:DUF2312 domain-containing protein [Agrobacterium fabrum]|uniref:GapR family DNA-binding domain-containing protein n=1 Tax=Agrobacterium fabrum TaxID=1176649 RepID=UPI000EF6062D|nr:GapR family DNA-binding domain-containing protein [Agrobacterium fabrum]AYM66177.1 hypothetical protein At12D13_50250 [Agrobacterium fabrum]NTE63924.1 DUF2312 domain-containing protein [Agrobacterium fabrum]
MTDMLAHFVSRLVPLWKERANVLDHIKDARREKRTSSVDRLTVERKMIDADIEKVLQEAKAHGLDPRAVEIIGRETMETRKQREERQEFEIVLQHYRESLAKAGSY